MPAGGRLPVLDRLCLCLGVFWVSFCAANFALVLSRMACVLARIAAFFASASSISTPERRLTDMATAQNKMRKINFNQDCLCYFLTKFYVWPLVRIVLMRRFLQVFKHRIWWRYRHNWNKNMHLTWSPVWLWSEYQSTHPIWDTDTTRLLLNRKHAGAKTRDHKWALTLAAACLPLNSMSKFDED